MANEIDKKQRNDLSADDQADLFLHYGDAATARPFDGDLLLFNKGDYLAGQNKEDVPIGTRFHAKMSELKVGWVCWQAGAAVEHRMGHVSQAFQPARRTELGDLDQQNWERDDDGKPKDPWQFTNHLPMNRDDDGKLHTFVTSSKGGLSCIGTLCKEYGEHIRQHPDKEPLIEIDVSSYQHRDRSLGRIKYPIFTVVKWVPKNDDGGGQPAAAEPPKAPPPAGKPAAAKPAHKPTATQPQF
jgi:hypothetical protein